MAKITYISHDGEERQVDVKDGWSVMEGAIHNDVEGIEAECGGCCSCATCHVYVEEDWLDKLPEPDDIEQEMLESTADERKPNSRLSCQIKVSPALDGLVVHTPEHQI